jgi:hypothetical protein
MQINESRMKENDREERWYARMNELEALWLTRMAETRKEYLELFVQVTRKRSESDFPR